MEDEMKQSSSSLQFKNKIFSHNSKNVIVIASENNHFLLPRKNKIQILKPQISTNAVVLPIDAENDLQLKLY
jgi:hypothetical protein